MYLKDIINAFPVSRRESVRTYLATACERDSVTIRSWANGTRAVPRSQFNNLARAVKVLGKEHGHTFEITPEDVWEGFRNVV